MMNSIEMRQGVSRQFFSIVAAVLVPFLLFVVVIGLNESDFDREKLQGGATNFELERQQQITKERPKPKPKQQERQPRRDLPSIQPNAIGSDLSGSGLSFGVPLFDQAQFAEFDDANLIGSAGDQVMDKSTVDVPPKVRKRSPIVYPELARKQGVSGYVTMNVLIDEQGNIEDVDIIESKPAEIFDLKAESTIRRWKFEPGTYNGQKVKVWAMQKIVFKLDR
ncbi:hypothetical protein A3762_22275 [Oleiphilus sp. HI0125]|uniref:energy transducer TonB n=2 Tax=unclassified Oleiphilus TaxID=2631174 RepID=UPI0007C2C0DD|nr:energy transducer TonB [Oleiphilus sp. HI0125]KZZ61190.1 hypothetical protein A3762_14585 [Oleiphilus sp. HI0125]KZZ63306.1 hypothetical protein A3762_22275 [Oleiphilus sp. HI0125]